MTHVSDRDFAHIQAGIFDLNGVLRGKRLPSSALAKLKENGFSMPLSVQNVDAQGADIENSPLVFESGDQDGTAKWTGRTELPISWLSRPAALLPMALYNSDGSPFEGCPRAALSNMLDQLSAADIRPRAGIELEFTIFDEQGETFTNQADILSLTALDKIDGLLARIEEASNAQNIAYESITSEAGTGQYEIVFASSLDLLKL